MLSDWGYGPQDFGQFPDDDPPGCCESCRDEFHNPRATGPDRLCDGCREWVAGMDAAAEADELWRAEQDKKHGTYDRPTPEDAPW